MNTNENQEDEVETVQYDEKNQQSTNSQIDFDSSASDFNVVQSKKNKLTGWIILIITITLCIAALMILFFFLFTYIGVKNHEQD